MPKKKKESVITLDDAIQDMAREQVNKSVKGYEESSPIEEVADGLVQNEEQHAAGLLDSIPQGEGWYAKVYRRSPVPDYLKGRPLLVYTFKDLSLIQDFESELLTVGSKSGWENGLYEIHIMKVGAPGRKERQFALEFPKEITPEAPLPKAEVAAKDPIEYLSSASKFIREIVADQYKGGNGVPPAGPDPTEMLKAYSELVKNTQQPPPSSNPIDWGSVLTALTPIFAPKPTPTFPLAEVLTALGPLVTPLLQSLTARKQDTFVSNLASAKEAGLLGDSRNNGHNPPDPLKYINAFREAGLITQPQDPMQQIEKFAGLIGVFTPILEKLGGNGGSTSVGVELVKSIGPQLGKMVGDVTSTINTAIQAKTAIASQSHPQIEKITRDITPNSPTPTTTPPPTNLNPLVAAIESRDKAFYPALKEMIIQSFTQEGYNSIVSGDIPLSEILTQLATYHPIFKEQRASIYFTEFIAWTKMNEVDVVCDKCKESYIFDSKEEFESKEQFCEECGGKLRVQSEEKTIITDDPVIPNQNQVFTDGIEI